MNFRHIGNRNFWNAGEYRAFTLLEILVTVLTLIILTTVTLLSITELSDSADATRIFNNLVNIKIAAIAWSKENSDKVVDGGANIKIGSSKSWIQRANQNNALGITKYLDGDGRNIILNEGTQDEIKKGGYGIYNTGGGQKVNDIEENRKTWFVGYRFNDGQEGVKDKLKGKRFKLGLHFTNKWPCKKNEAENTVWLKVRGDYDFVN